MMRTILLLLICCCSLVSFSQRYARSGSQSRIDSFISDHLKSFWEDRSDTIIDKPYALHFKHQKKEVVFFGTHHDIRDFSDSMFVHLEEAITGFDPDMILVERYHPVATTKEKAALEFGDAGFCRFMGFKNHIPVGSWDRSWNKPYYALLKQYSADELFTMLFSFMNFAYSPADYATYEDYYAAQVSSLELSGWPFPPKYRQASYYYKKYKAYFKETFDSSPAMFDRQYNRQKLTPLYYQVFHSLQQLRDIQLVKSLRESLRTHDKIFIQAGSNHLSSLKRIIPMVLEAAPDTILAAIGNKPTTSEKITLIDSLGHMFTASTGDKSVYVLGTYHTIRNNQDVMFRRGKMEMAQFKPDMILTQGLDPVYPTEKETALKSGDVGFIRYLGIEKGIPVSSWEPAWDDVYYKLSKKYSPDDIYFSLLGWAIVRNSVGYENYSSFNDFFESVYKPFFIYGYPFQPDQLEGDHFLQSLEKYLKKRVLSATYGTPVADPGNPPGAMMAVKPDGTYHLKGKPGKYAYSVQLCPPDAEANTCVTTSISITLAGADPNALVEITGMLQAPSTLVTITHLKSILRECIKQDIIEDMHAIRSAWLLQVIREHQPEFNRILVQADVRYLKDLVKASD